eukprot:4134906-Karenia_brevis.AAC.1
MGNAQTPTHSTTLHRPSTQPLRRPNSTCANGPEESHVQNTMRHETGGSSEFLAVQCFARGCFRTGHANLVGKAVWHQSWTIGTPLLDQPPLCG